MINIENEIGQIEFIRDILMDRPPMLARRVNHLVMYLSFVKLAKDLVISIDLTDRYHIQNCPIGFDFEWIRGDRFKTSVDILPYKLQPQNLRVNYSNIMEIKYAQGGYIA